MLNFIIGAVVVYIAFRVVVFLGCVIYAFFDTLLRG